MEYSCEYCGGQAFEKTFRKKNLRFRDSKFEVEYECMLCANCQEDAYLSPKQAKDQSALLVKLYKKEQLREVR